MAQTFDLSQNFEISLIGPDKLTVLVSDDPLLDCAPCAYSDTAKVTWEQPEDGYGLLSLRGQDSEPPTEGVPGVRQMTMSPGYYGQRSMVTETEQNEAREYGTPNEPMNIEKRLAYIQDQILMRSVDRMRQVLSQFFRTGQFLVVNASGSVTHADTMEGYASRNVFAPAVGWAASPATATPIQDMLGWQASLQLGTSSIFDDKSTLLASDPTINDLLGTAQIQSQIKGPYGSTIAGLKPLNELLRGYGLPQLERYNESYYATKADAKARTGAIRHIPAKSLIWKGYRKDGAQPAQFQFTRSAIKNPPAGVAQNAPGYKLDNAGLRGEIDKGLWTIVEYQLVPPLYTLNTGFNGGPAVRYPSCFAGISYT